MAPTAPGPKRLTGRAKAAARLSNPLLPRKLHRPDNAVTDSFLSTKRDKRLIRSSSFRSSIAKPSEPVIRKKRRRPNRKLVTTLESLGDALDEIVREEGNRAADEGMSEDQRRMGRTRHKSLRSRPGALKRKEKIVKTEMERFGRSLAELQTVGMTQRKGEGCEEVQPPGTNNSGSGEGEKVASTVTTSRWAALRGFINATMEQNPAFMGGGR